MTRGRQFLYTSALAAILLSTVCLFTPLLVYSGNPSEFTASFAQITISYLPYMASLICVAGTLAALLNANGYLRLQSFLGALVCLLWLQSNILVWDYGVLDGRSIEWTVGAWRGALDTLIWAGVLLVAIYAYNRAGRLFAQAAIAVFVIQLAGAALQLVSGDAVSLQNSDISANQTSKDALARFSSTKNVVHIVMDGLQTDLFERILDNPANGDYKKQLQGFTVFRNNLGAFPYTQLTIPAMLSGNVYHNHIPVDDFIDETLTGSTILNAASEAGFEVDIAAQVALKNIYALNRHANAFGITNSNHVSARDYIVNDSARLIDLSLFRAVPHFAKALVQRDELWVFQGRVRSSSYLNMQYFADLAFLRGLPQEMRADRDAPVYKIMHLMFAHLPTVGDENCEFDGRRGPSRENVMQQANCGLQSVLDVFERMKALGIYEESTIVLIADHGAWVRVDGFDDENKNDAVSKLDVAMAIPLLAIKRGNDTGPYRVSNAQTAITDLPATIAAEIGLNERFPGVDTFAIRESDARERRHYKYAYGNNRKAPGYLYPMFEVIVNGSVDDPGAWTRGKKYLPRGEVSEY